MRGAVSLKIGLGFLLVTGGFAWIMSGVVSCGTAPTPFLVRGPGTIGNDPPTLDIIQPNANLTAGQGDPFLIRWTDRDRDDNASISFSLVNAATNDVILLVAGIDENDAIGPDLVTVSTTLIQPGAYNLLGVISDSVNPQLKRLRPWRVRRFRSG